MDVERERRHELIAALGDHFRCFEEVWLRHALFRRARLRADVVAIPLDPMMRGYALAFEVKDPSRRKLWQSKHWLHAIRQAADYVYATIEPHPALERQADRRIAASFLFPAPPSSAGGFSLDSGCSGLAGAMLLALQFRVGRAFREEGKHRRFVLGFGPNEVWRSDVGFTASAPGLLSGKRTVGSQKFDILTELGGYGPAGMSTIDGIPEFD